MGRCLQVGGVVQVPRTRSRRAALLTCDGAKDPSNPSQYTASLEYILEKQFSSAKMIFFPSHSNYTESFGSFPFHFVFFKCCVGDVKKPCVPFKHASIWPKPIRKACEWLKLVC